MAASCTAGAWMRRVSGSLCDKSGEDAALSERSGREGFSKDHWFNCVDTATAAMTESCAQTVERRRVRRVYRSSGVWSGSGRLYG